MSKNMNQDDFRKLMATPRPNSEASKALGQRNLKKVGSVTAIVPRNVQTAKKATAVLPFKKSILRREGSSSSSTSARQTGIGTLEDAKDVIKKLMAKDTAQVAGKDILEQVEESDAESEESLSLLAEQQQQQLQPEPKINAQELLRATRNIEKPRQVRKYNPGRSYYVFDMNLSGPDDKPGIWGEEPQLKMRKADEYNRLMKYVDVPGGSAHSLLKRSTDVSNDDRHQPQKSEDVKPNEKLEDLNESDGNESDDIFGDLDDSTPIISLTNISNNNKEKLSGKDLFDKRVIDEELEQSKDYLSSLLGGSAAAKLQEGKAKSLKMDAKLDKIEGREVLDSNYMDVSETKHAKISAFAYNEIESSEGEEEIDEEFVASLPKNQSDFKSEEEWKVYLQSQMLKRNAGSFDIDMNNYKVIDEKDFSKHKATKFGHDLMKLDNMMKRKYGESINLKGSGPKKQKN